MLSQPNARAVQSSAPSQTGTRVHAYPRGNVTFLFSDIQGSTRRWEHDPAAMQVVVERHFDLLRGAIETHGGVLFKTIGDAVQAAFPATPPAVAAALAGQRAVASADWGDDGRIWVRMGLHSGPATPGDGDYHALCLNCLARLLPAGYGGQILLLHAVAETVRQSLPLRPAPPCATWANIACAISSRTSTSTSSTHPTWRAVSRR
ncbi:MAG TPA: adenylate/guanylate cyclase domain-containing protein [Thermomicrobiales bacterium]|nr:adenylate/guanylate cyclase domain-containing protein [Thermomicrobiales bacterium]